MNYKHIQVKYVGNPKPMRLHLLEGNWGEWTLFDRRSDSPAFATAHQAVQALKKEYPYCVEDLSDNKVRFCLSGMEEYLGDWNPSHFYTYVDGKFYMTEWFVHEESPSCHSGIPSIC